MAQLEHRRSLSTFWSELWLDRPLPSLTTGVLIGIAEFFFALSVGSFIFAGDLAQYLNFGISVALVTSTVMLVIISLGSSFPGVTGSLQDSPATILAIIVAGLLATLSTAGEEELLATLLVVIALTAILTGVFFLTMGVFRLGGLVRFLPYPVIGGFLAATGWLLIRGSFTIMLGTLPTITDLLTFLQPDQLILWVPGVIFALVLFIVTRNTRHILAFPAALLVAFALYFAVLLALGVSFNQAGEAGLLLGGGSGSAIWNPFAITKVLAVNWSAVLLQSGNIIVILLVSVVNLLLNASAIELTYQQDVDFNRELRVAGFANILSGLFGGAVGYQALDISVLSHRTRGRGRVVGLIAAAICLLMFTLGAPLTPFFPRAILGGILLYMGLGFFYDWVIEGWSKLQRVDYAVVLLILITVLTTNFLVGVGVGLVAMIIIFVVNYSRVNVVRHEFTGKEMKSNVERGIYHQRVLRAQGNHIYILDLQGFIFFGTANAILEQVKTRVNNAEQPKISFLILDFCNVNGLDSSAALSFVRCRQFCESQGITMLLSQVSEEDQRDFEFAGLFSENGNVQVFTDLDRAMEWCENQLLERDKVTMLMMPLNLPAQLEASGFEESDAKQLVEYLEKTQFEQGEYLVHQGDQVNALYFIEMGEVTVYLEYENGKRVRLRSLGTGTVVGELDFYYSDHSVASIIADIPTIAYCLTQDTILKIEEQNPKLVAALHEFMVRLLSDRLVGTTQLLEAVFR